MKNAKKSSVKSRLNKQFDKISNVVTRVAGRPVASITAFMLIILWALCGPFFHYSDTWQLVINTSTTIITFLMVFVIQQSQNKETTAMQLKLNELIACNENASNRLVDIEDLTDEELQVLRKFYIKLSRLAEKDNDLFGSHSVDEAEAGYTKVRRRKKNNTTNSPKS